MLALVAIVVPVTIIAALGYVSLRQWEASSDLLFREQARDMASMALRHKFEADLDHPVHILTVHGQGYKFTGV